MRSFQNVLVHLSVMSTKLKNQTELFYAAKTSNGMEKPHAHQKGETMHIKVLPDLQIACKIVSGGKPKIPTALHCCTHSRSPGLGCQCNSPVQVIVSITSLGSGLLGLVGDILLLLIPLNTGS